MNKRVWGFSLIYGVSFSFLILHLNFNVKTFRLTQRLQVVTLELYQVQADVSKKELEYFTKTNLTNVYDVAVNQLGMQRQSQIRPFSNEAIDFR